MHHITGSIVFGLMVGVPEPSVDKGTLIVQLPHQSWNSGWIDEWKHTGQQVFNHRQIKHQGNTLLLNTSS